MARLNAPDLRKLLVGLGTSIHESHPHLLSMKDVKRIQEANNVLLVLTRILIGMAKRSTLSDEEVHQIVEQARYVPESTDLFESKPLDDGVITGRRTMWDAINMMDGAMHDPKSRSQIPDWFLNDFWPGVLRRIAIGEGMTDREREIAMYVASTAIGER